MLTVLATVGLAGAYALLWRHAHLKGRRLRAEQARARRLAYRPVVSEITVRGPYEPTFMGMPVVHDDRIPVGSFALVDAEGRIQAWGSI